MRFCQENVYIQSDRACASMGPSDAVVVPFGDFKTYVCLSVCRPVSSILHCHAQALMIIRNGRREKKFTAPLHVIHTRIGHIVWNFDVTFFITTN